MGNPDDGMTSLLMTDGATTNVMEARRPFSHAPPGMDAEIRLFCGIWQMGFGFRRVLIREPERERRRQASQPGLLLLLFYETPVTSEGEAQ